MIKVKIVKSLMNAFPSRPKYQEKQFIQEIFRHPRYCSLTQHKKELLHEKLVVYNYLEEKKKPFDLFYPSYSFTEYLKGKRVLDLGCSIGGKTIFLGQRWKVSEFYGIDVNQKVIDAANHFLSKFETNIHYIFLQSYAEEMSLEDEFFDAIISHDVIEHVRSVKKTLSECKRVLKKNGIAFIVFPSFNLPFGGAHISSVTKTPFIEWFFSPETINMAYEEIINEWGDDLNWYKPTTETKGDWAIVKGGIGINGTRYREFVSIAKEVGFNKITFIQIPLLYVSNTAIKYPAIRFFSYLLKPLLSIDFLKDYLAHRLTFVLEK